MAGLLLGAGSSFTNATMPEAYGLTEIIYPGSILYTVLDIMNQCGNAVFANLALLFSMGVSIGYLVMDTAISAMINANGGMAANSATSALGITEPPEFTFLFVAPLMYVGHYIYTGLSYMLMHIGIDTVKLGGKHFEAHVAPEQTVKKGDLLMSFDMEAIKAAGYPLTTLLIVCNTDDYAAVKTLSSGSVKTGTDLLGVE